MYRLLILRGPDNGLLLVLKQHTVLLQFINYGCKVKYLSTVTSQDHSRWFIVHYTPGFLRFKSGTFCDVQEVAFPSPVSYTFLNIFTPNSHAYFTKVPPSICRRRIRGEVTTKYKNGLYPPL